MPDSLEKLAILCNDFGHTRREPLRIAGTPMARVVRGCRFNALQDDDLWSA